MPADLVPADNLICWHAREYPDTAPASATQASAVATFLDLSTRLLGQPDSIAQLIARIVEGFNLWIRHPHAIALIDATAIPSRPDGTGRKLGELRLVIVVQARGQSEPFLRLIQKVVNEQTDAQNATLERKAAENWNYQELVDRRRPNWTLAWGEIGEYFVCTIGPGVWPQVASVAAGKHGALGREEWYRKVREKRAGRTLVEISLDAKRVRDRLDPLLHDRATAFFKAWQAEDVERAYWAFGLDGRAMFCLASFLERGGVREKLYADPDMRDPRLLDTVPDKARYSIFHVDVPTVIPKLAAGVVATRDAASARTINELWRKIQAERGFDVQRDLLAHLGEWIVFHDYPPHPLRLPAVITALVEIRDEPQRVRRTVDTICQAWKDATERAAERQGSLLSHTLRLDDDGVWYVMIGPFAGAAWTVTDRFFIISWSPTALRQYMSQAGRRVGTLIAPVAPQPPTATASSPSERND
jgi:hypothetical protein